MGGYRMALDTANKAGAANATDAGVMAQFCAGSLQLMVGAVSPELVWNGAQKQGLTALDLARLAVDNPTAVHDLMWL